jgi:hypothetical protein
MGPLPSISQRLWRTEDDEQLDLLEVFCGEDRPGDLRDATIAAGGIASGIDTRLAGANHDMQDDVVFDAVYRLVARGRVRNLWIGVVCSSLSQLWLKKGRPRLRSRRQPDGVYPMPPQWRRYIYRANKLIQRAEALAYVQWRVGGTYYIENPADVGCWASPHFKWSRRDAVSLWITSPIRRLAQLTDPTWGTTAMCGWAGPFQKLTTIMAAGPGAPPVITINSIQCNCESHALLADGLDSEGRQLSELAGQYPPLFCGFFAHNFMSQETWSADVAAAITPPAARLLQIIAAQRPPPKALVASTSGSGTCEQITETIIEGRAKWRSAFSAIPRDWPEHEDVLGPLYQAVRAEPLSFISRRRAEPEEPEVLAARAMPDPSPPQRSERDPPRLETGWPSGAPPRPISIDRLYHPGIYDEIIKTVSAIKAACKTGEATGRMPKAPSKAFKADECQPDWARAVDWDTENPLDVIPFEQGDTPPQHCVNPSFFSTWAKRLEWPDKQMIQQVCETGIRDGSERCTRATVVSCHHKGLRDHFAEAAASIAADVSLGFMTTGRQHLRRVPSIMVPKNCVERRQWKLSEEGNLLRSIKWRVTTDDSISVDGETSRNEGMDPEAWVKPGLPSARSLAEMVAIVKSSCNAMNLNATRFELERIALWAFDLSHAYRELAVLRSSPNRSFLSKPPPHKRSASHQSEHRLPQIDRAEQGRQCFVWWDGVRLDLRCVFGAAHMVDFFQRVTSFILGVGRFRIREYESQHPFSPEREKWRLWRANECNLNDGCGQSVIYIDDGLGLTVLGPGEPLVGHVDFHTKPIQASTHVDPGGTVKLACFANQSRAQVDLAIMRYTFNEAGWGIAVDKIQLGFQLNQLGMMLSSEGDGAMLVPEPKRQGMLVEIAEQQEPQDIDGAVPTEDVEGLVGRCLHIAMAAHEANAYLQPMYAMKEAKRTVGQRADGSKIRVQPSRLVVRGTKPAQVAYRESLDWWAQALHDGISTPLAPKLTFPELGEPGSHFMFTDAAREDGTGIGAFTFVEDDRGNLKFLYHDPRWPPDVATALQQDKLSMPAGEGIGAVAFADSLLTAVPSITHLTIFTDSSAVQQAFQSSSSGSPQLNFIVSWLFQRHPDVQFMAIHQPGVRNTAADRLSRTDSAAVLREAAATGAAILHIPLQQHAYDLMREAMAKPQRPRPSPHTQDA